ncbi:MAG: cytochrome c [Gallionella sp.]|jgi:cytochrome c553|nr:cytochrome c [Gallionella sp.]
MKKFLLALALLSLSGIALANPFPKGNAQTGQQLFAKYDCSSCHKGKMGGDGSAIFTRANRTVSSPDELLVQMERCSGAIGKSLSGQEKQDLAAYLNKTYYRFK